MQQHRASSRGCWTKFQSSPVPEGPVTGWAATHNSGTLFQSSPVPRDRCNLIRGKDEVYAELFQSSPVPRDRCNWCKRFGSTGDSVSILTGPEGPVQPARWLAGKSK